MKVNILHFQEFTCYGPLEYPEDARKLVTDFKAIYKGIGSDDFKKAEVEFLSKLADIYVKRAEASSTKWVELVKVSWIDLYNIMLS